MFIVAITLPHIGRAGAPIGSPVRLVFVEPEGEKFTEEELAVASDEIGRAILWWNDLLPEHTIYVADTQIITAPSDVYIYSADGRYIDMSNLFIVDNSLSGRLILDHYLGAMTMLNQAWVVATAPYLASTVAHELGHVVYQLPDWYLDPSKCISEIDIMCADYVAFTSHFIGCRSLERLGRPCKNVYIPVVRLSY